MERGIYEIISSWEPIDWNRLFIIGQMPIGLQFIISIIVINTNIYIIILFHLVVYECILFDIFCFVFFCLFSSVRDDKRLILFFPFVYGKPIVNLNCYRRHAVSKGVGHGARWNNHCRAVKEVETIIATRWVEQTNCRIK